MKNKERSLLLHREREAKLRRNLFFGQYLPMQEGLFSISPVMQSEARVIRFFD